MSIRKMTLSLTAAAITLSLTACGGGPFPPFPQTSQAPAQQPTQAPAKPQQEVSQPVATPPAPAAPTNVLTQPLRQPGMAMDLLECSRRDGVMTVKVAFRNTSTKSIVLTSVNSDLASYVLANSKKYLSLTDSQGTPLTAGPIIGHTLEPGQSVRWWAKFPAPPADIKTVAYYATNVEPFDDVPVLDKR